MKEEELIEWWCRRCNATQKVLSITTVVYCAEGHRMKRVEPVPFTGRGAA